MKIVKFENGKYGVEKGFLFKKYLDLISPPFEWTCGDKYFDHCQGTMENCKDAINKRYPKIIAKWKI